MHDIVDLFQRENETEETKLNSNTVDSVKWLKWIEKFNTKVKNKTLILWTLLND
mgnify:CR=1 FL=1